MDYSQYTLLKEFKKIVLHERSAVKNSFSTWVMGMSYTRTVCFDWICTFINSPYQKVFFYPKREGIVMPILFMDNNFFGEGIDRGNTVNTSISFFSLFFLPHFSILQISVIWTMFLHIIDSLFINYETEWMLYL